MDALPDRPHDEVLVDDPSWGPADEEALWAQILAEPRTLLDTAPEELSGRQVIDYLVELQRAQARLASLEAQALVVAAGAEVRSREVTVLERDGHGERRLTIADEVREEIAAALHRSPGAVYDQIATARLLATALPATAAALAEGTITAQHARTIADQCRRMGGAVLVVHQAPTCDTADDAAERAHFVASCHEIERRVLPIAQRTTVGRTRSAAARAVASVDAAGEEERRQRALALMDVTVCPEPDGLAMLLARFPIEHAVRVQAAIDARAEALGGSAPIGVRRVQVLLDALCRPGAAAATPVGVEIQVVVPADALLGLSDEPGSVVTRSGTHEPITSLALRHLLADESLPITLRRLVTNPATGHLLDRGRRSYAVTGALRDFLASRDRTCRFPGCTCAAQRCEVDHVVPWDDGGGSDRDNTGHLCARHHQLKTHGGWEITESSADGACTWRSPTGREYDVDPPPF